MLLLLLLLVLLLMPAAVGLLILQYKKINKFKFELNLINLSQ